MALDSAVWLLRNMTNINGRKIHINVWVKNMVTFGLKRSVPDALIFLNGLHYSGFSDFIKVRTALEGFRKHSCKVEVILEYTLCMLNLYVAMFCCWLGLSLLQTLTMEFLLH